MGSGCSSMVEQQPSKLNTRVRFPSPALELTHKNSEAVVAQLVEHFLGKEEVVGSSPTNSSCSETYRIVERGAMRHRFCFSPGQSVGIASS